MGGGIQTGIEMGIGMRVRMRMDMEIDMEKVKDETSREHSTAQQLQRRVKLEEISNMINSICFKSSTSPSLARS